MSKELISKSSIDISASSPKIWEALVKPEIAKEYFFGAEIVTDWKVGSPITFKGEFNGNKYEEKGVLLNVEPNAQLQYSHWSNFDGLPDESENYRTWTFDIIGKAVSSGVGVPMGASTYVVSEEYGMTAVAIKYK